jgi:transposase
MSRYDIPDDLWNKIEPWLLSMRRDPRGARNATPDRTIFNGLMWLMHTGAPWRDLPPQFGPWQTVYRRFRKWNNEGVWEHLLAELTKHYDDEAIMIDATVIKVNQAGTGAKGGTSIRRSANPKGV